MDGDHELVAASSRDEIAGHCHHVGRTKLAETVERIDDETTLQAIFSRADTLRREARADDKSLEVASVSIDTVYARAAEQVLRTAVRRSTTVDAAKRERLLCQLRLGEAFACGSRYYKEAREIFHAALAAGLDVKMIEYDGMAVEVVPCPPEERGQVLLR